MNPSDDEKEVRRVAEPRFLQCALFLSAAVFLRMPFRACQQYKKQQRKHHSLSLLFQILYL